MISGSTLHPLTSGLRSNPSPLTNQTEDIFTKLCAALFPKKFMYMEGL